MLQFPEALSFIPNTLPHLDTDGSNALVPRRSRNRAGGVYTPGYLPFRQVLDGALPDHVSLSFQTA